MFPANRTMFTVVPTYRSGKDNASPFGIISPNMSTTTANNASIIHSTTMAYVAS